jgi:Family of unknown function (DUF5309)
MPGSAAVNFGAYRFDGSDLISGVAKEDLLEQITNISPYDTPFVSQAPKVGCRHIFHQWLQDSLAAVGTEPNALTGAVEGADWAYDATTAAIREHNITMILRKDLGLSESQRAVDTAGFADQYAYEVQKAGKELAVKLERLCFGLLSTSTGTSAAARVMRGLQSFITSNTAAASGSAANQDGVLTVTDFNDMLNAIYVQGGNPEQVYVSPKVKRQVSAFAVPGAAAGNVYAKNIAAVDKKLVGAIDFYDSDFGLIQIVLDRWVPESTNTVTGTAATATGGQMFFLSRAMNRIAWLRPVHHELIGKKGDSVAGYVVGECTLEVLAEKANGRITLVNNKSAVT